MGADDYLAKPFLPRELLARISAVFRRLDPDRLVQRGADLAVGPFRIDTARRTVTRDGAVLDLSGRAFALLIALARSAGRPLSRAQLIERALGRDAEVTDRAIDVQVTRLRRAIGDDPRAPRFIKTVWGIGYMMSDDDPT